MNQSESPAAMRLPGSQAVDVIPSAASIVSGASLRATMAVSILLVLATAYIVGTTLWAAWLAYTPLPFWDHWDHWRIVVQDGYSPAMLWSQHNEHRIFTARLLFWIDEHLFRGTNAFLIVSIFLVQLTHGLLLWRTSVGVEPFSRVDFVAQGALPVSAMFALHQHTNFTWAFQVQFVLVYLLATVAFVAFVGLAGSQSGAKFSRNSRLFLLLIAAWMATVTMANGLLVWPLFFVGAFWIALPRRDLLVIVANGALAWGLYFWRYVSPAHHGSLADSLGAWRRTIAHFFAYLGSPVDQPLALLGGLFNDPQARVAVAIVVGFIGVLLWVFQSYRLILHDRRYLGGHFVLWLIATFALGTGVLIALGRVPMFPLTEAMTSRYLTPALLYWVALALMARPLPILCTDRRIDLRFSVGVLVVLVFGIATVQVPRMTDARSAAKYLSAVASAVGADVYDPLIWGRSYHTPQALGSVADYLREHRLSLFAEPRMQLVGQQFRSRFDIAATSGCVGYIDEVALIDEGMRRGFRIRGRAWGGQDVGRDGFVLFVNGQGAIVGVTPLSEVRTDVPQALRDQVPSAEVGWLGYVNARNSGQTEVFIVSLESNRGCRIGSASLAGR
jgi:hypothetical protein